MKVGLTIFLATLCMLAWTSPAQTRMERVCSGKQPARTELVCGKKNLHRATSVLRFLRLFPNAGTRHDRAVLRRDHTWLQKYALWHISHAQARTRPSVPACTDDLLNLEGGWDPHATNPSSGAYGGPQALPGSKMKTAGSDWAHNIWTQIRWMIGYVNGRYGGMCNALSFRIANGYY
jgi:hypothetical protein